jgi:hypothetical protein
MLALLPCGAGARDAAFMDPGGMATGPVSDEAVKVEPKGDIDTGESVMNVAKRTTVFFVNQTTLPLQVQKVEVNGDGNVHAELASNDCSKQGSIAPNSRCSVEVAVTPTSPGQWSVDLLMTHTGAGRLARAKLIGKTSGSTANEKKDMGLALNTKEVNPINFGDIDVGSGKAVRSALMVNDSPEAITIYAIDIIEADNGLQRLDTGCAIDMELKPGESCPVTMLWQPTAGGQISTDLIIRHSGRLGFAVIPVRGNAKGAPTQKDTAPKNVTAAVPPPPTAQELAAALGTRVEPIHVDAPPPPIAVLRLIGTVGNHAVIQKPDGSTTVVADGDEFDINGQDAKVTGLTAKSATLTINGKKRVLTLEASPELMQRANDDRKKAEASGETSSGKTSGKTGGSGK